MNKNSLILNVIVAVLGLLMVLAVFTWAPACDGQLELANGNFVAMKCVHAVKAAACFGVILVAVALDGMLKKKVSVLPIIVIGIFLLLLPKASAFGIGICVKETMVCQTAGLWMRIIGGLTALAGVAGFFLKGKKDL